MVVVHEQLTDVEIEQLVDGGLTWSEDQATEAAARI
jgi:hypothetical protein